MLECSAAIGVFDLILQCIDHRFGIGIWDIAIDRECDEVEATVHPRFEFSLSLIFQSLGCLLDTGEAVEGVFLTATKEIMSE